MSKEKQIEEMVDVLVGGHHEMDIAWTNYFCDKKSPKPQPEHIILANALYNAGYRKKIAGEWIYKFTLDGDKFYECSVCGRQEVVNCLCTKINITEDRPYCHCGAKMKGGAE